MDRQTMIINKGEIFILSQGEYSHYHPIALCRAIRKIDISEQQDQWLRLHPEQEGKFKFLVDKFIKWLMEDSGLVEEIGWKEWYLGPEDTVDFSDSYFANPIGYNIQNE